MSDEPQEAVATLLAIEAVLNFDKMTPENKVKAIYQMVVES